MINGVKKLSIAFYWHFHQPVYSLENTYLMPWVRLHAVKDYLDMLLIMKKFPKLKMNFNLDCGLLDSLIDYTEKGMSDIPAQLTCKPVDDLTTDEREFILNNFFSAKYATMIYHHERYKELYKKAIVNENLTIDDFSDSEISDLMALFNLSWMDPTHKDHFPELRKFIKKDRNYSLEDRIEIIKFHEKIMASIIPAYKKFAEEGRIEITTSPYYHPILPILLDVKNATANTPVSDDLPDNLKTKDDAYNQTLNALNRIEELFGIRPKGIWASELCLNEKTLKMFQELGINWTISDEKVLARSTGHEFIRDFKGNLKDPYHLLKTYNYKKNDKNINIVFRDSSIPSLINFEYHNYESKVSAEDLYGKIKLIQNKILTSPDDNHLITIALDGENCWDSYANDGQDFLERLYGLIEEDDSLETVLLSDYIENDTNKKELTTLKSGSWADNNFKLWIGDPVKDLAWTYLKLVREDIINYGKANKLDISKSMRELYIAEGSDWFWWYGEPNHSEQDYIFDYLFREHLKSSYKYLGINYPDFLDKPLITAYNSSTRNPHGVINPSISGNSNEDFEWLNAGCIALPDGPVFQEGKVFDKICYGYSDNNAYFRIYVNPNYFSKTDDNRKINQLFIYTRNMSRRGKASRIRVVNKTENVFPLLKEKFGHELLIELQNETMFPIEFAKASSDGLWQVARSQNIRTSYGNVIDVCVPFEDLGIEQGESIEFFFLTAIGGIKETFIPQDSFLVMERPISNQLNEDAEMVQYS